MKIFTLLLGLAPLLCAHPIEFHNDPFRQLDEVWPTPTETRLASGAPGPKYWQQRADYDLKIELDEKKDLLTGSGRVVYHNKSPHTLTYLWVQLDRNRFNRNSLGHQSAEAPEFKGMSFRQLDQTLATEKYDGGFKIDSLVDDRGAALKHRIVDTMMRIDLPSPLKPGKNFSYRMAWHYKLNNAGNSWGRSSFEKYKDGNKVFEIAQWFPRLAAYTDHRGWQNKAFQGRGEFALEFGDYKVAITVPDDHVVTATGELRNPDACLKKEWKERLKEAGNAKKPMFIITPEEAGENEKSKPSGTKTWVFEAKNVRDFAWATSRKFIWDAVKHRLPNSNKPVWAMSFYPNEGEPLWSQYSTHAIIHTLNVYSKFTFDYPYPVAISVNGPVYGMEYPMICFNGPQPEDDGTYTESTKNGLISVIIHEVGHNWFPMIVNSDERQWSWMDEGLNTFLQMLTEQEWREDYPSRADPRKITGYMKSANQRPIMTNSESILQFGANAYAKPAVGLSILRETIMGREIFDDAFQEFSKRWMFKRPEPSDFFRTMEDAAGIDLDWFWHSWFYTTRHVDLAVTDITRYQLSDGNPKTATKDKKEEDRQYKEDSVTSRRNKGIPKYVEANKELRDFYDKLDRFELTKEDRDAFKKKIADLKPSERALLKSKKEFQVVTFENLGGVIMPILVELEFKGGKTQSLSLPAEIWKKNHRKVKRLFITKSPIISVTVDPGNRTADIRTRNNTWPPKVNETDFTPTPKKEESNPMREAREKKERKKENDSKKDK
ncbi:MAG: M1 family metallopeptidase [Verrucomicrobiaceae bacterium]